jgi:acyl dehydratase
MAQTIDPGTAQVGDELPPFRRTTGLPNWVRYAAVNDEFGLIHIDDEVGRTAGYPTAFGMGNLQWSYLHSLLRNWLGDRGTIRTIRCQFRAPNTKGMTVTARGTVTRVEETHAGREIELEVWTEDDNGNRLAPGAATVTLRR